MPATTMTMTMTMTTAGLATITTTIHPRISKATGCLWLPFCST